MSDNRYTTYSSSNTVFDADLNAVNFTNGSRKLSSAIDNSSQLYFWDDLEFYCTFAATPSANATVELYLIPSIDGTNYADGDASTDPPATSLVGVFPIRAVTSAQRIAVRGVQLPPGSFKYLIINRTGVASSGTSNTLIRRSYSTQNVIV